MDKKPEILVSLIIPIYNVEDYIEKCLCSALSQTLSGIEIILVNDGSRDGSMKVVDTFANKHPNIIIINKENGGLSSARNSGLKVAKGKYISFMDSDDYIDKTMLEKMYTKAEKGELDIVACNLTKVDAEGKSMEDEKNTVDYSHIYNSQQAIYEYLTNNIPAYAWNKLYRRSLFLDYEITYPVGKLYEDIGTSFELFAKAVKVGFIDESLYLYVQRQGAITKVPSFKAGKDIISTVDGIKASLVKSKIYDKFEETFQSFTLKYLFLANVLFYKRYHQTKEIDELNSFKELVSLRISEINSKTILSNKYLNIRDKFKYILLKTGFIYLAVTIKVTFQKAKNKLCMED